MTKYDVEFKLAVVTVYLASEAGYKSLTNQFSITDKSAVKN